jgi:hypothetical protein
MKFPIRIHRTWLRRVALGLAVAAVGAPAAQAYDYHRPFGMGPGSGSLPCAPSCVPEPGDSASPTPALDRAHPRGGLMRAGFVPQELTGRSARVVVETSQTTGSATAGRFRVPLGLERDIEPVGGPSVGLTEVGAGVGIGAAFALFLAGIGAMLTRNRGSLAPA